MKNILKFFEETLVILMKPCIIFLDLMMNNIAKCLVALNIAMILLFMVGGASVAEVISVTVAVASVVLIEIYTNKKMQIHAEEYFKISDTDWKLTKEKKQEMTLPHILLTYIWIYPIMFCITNPIKIFLAFNAYVLARRMLGIITTVDLLVTTMLALVCTVSIWVLNKKLNKSLEH